MDQIRYSNSPIYDQTTSLELEFDFSDPDVFWEIEADYFGAGSIRIYDFDADIEQAIYYPTGYDVSYYMDFRDNTYFVNLYGGGNSDIFLGSLNYGSIYAGGGDDVIDIAGGANNADGDEGRDLLTFENATSAVYADMTYMMDSYSFDPDFVEFAGIYDIEDLTGTRFDDELIGSAGANVIQGGAGADKITGGGGSDTASYANSTSGVTVNLTTNVNARGDAEGDALFDVDNLLGSAHADILTGDGAANVLEGGDGDDTLRGMGGDDILLGGDGKDRLVLAEAGASVDGGAGADKLFLTWDDTFTFTDDNFKNIETIYVRGGRDPDVFSSLFLDVSGVGSGLTIVSQSVDQEIVEIVGTSKNDTISAGQGFDRVEGGDGDDRLIGGSGVGPAGLSVLFGDAGNDVLVGGRAINYLFGGEGDDLLNGSNSTGVLSGDGGNDRIVAGALSSQINGGEGADKLFGGDGVNIFFFSENFGRDNVYRFDVAKDLIDVSSVTADFEDINIRAINGGKNVLITFDVGGSGNKIILHDVDIDSFTAENLVLTTGPSDQSALFT